MVGPVHVLVVEYMGGVWVTMVCASGGSESIGPGPPDIGCNGDTGNGGWALRTWHVGSGVE